MTTPDELPKVTPETVTLSYDTYIELRTGHSQARAVSLLVRLVQANGDDSVLVAKLRETMYKAKVWNV